MFIQCFEKKKNQNILIQGLGINNDHFSRFGRGVEEEGKHIQQNFQNQRSG